MLRVYKLLSVWTTEAILKLVVQYAGTGKRESIGHTVKVRFPFAEVVELLGWIPDCAGMTRTKQNHYQPKGRERIPGLL